MLSSRMLSLVRMGRMALACLCLAPLALYGAPAPDHAAAAWKAAGADDGLR
jgi:hypothetical protein